MISIHVITQLYDVGMTAGLASDMLALAEVGTSWCNVFQNSTQDSTQKMTVNCTVDVLSRIKTLQNQAAKLANLTQVHLWDGDQSAFVNKLPANSYPNMPQDKFYERLSPTSFYPLMTGVPTTSQADQLATKHLLEPSGFCITRRKMNGHPMRQIIRCRMMLCFCRVGKNKPLLVQIHCHAMLKVK